jgi:hypothetical protein
LRRLEALLENDTAGDPVSGVKWTRKSLRALSRALRDNGHHACANTVRRLLKQLKFSLRVNQKELAGDPHPQRDDQFEYIAAQKAVFQAMGWPILSVDTKKKELIGQFKNPGRTWRQQPIAVNVHDFPQDAVGKAIPYGVYDLIRNQGVIFVGTSADTAQFAVECIAIWCQEDGKMHYPQAPVVLILCDGGGSNAYRSRLWKQQIQQEIADRLGLTVVVCHYPRGASKWNPIEHRVFSLISINWAGQPLADYETVMHYIETTRSDTGLSLKAVLVEKTYETGIKVPDVEMEALNLIHHPTCPQWNYTITPRVDASH